jgi:penicillin-binding protein 1A
VTVRPIRTQQDYDRALQELDGLIGAEPETEAADKLDVLATLVAAYEAKGRPHRQADPVELIELALRRSNKGQTELAALLGSRSRASEILNRKRKLSSEMIAKLSTTLAIPAALLAVPYEVAAGRVRRAVMGGMGVLAIITGGAIAGAASLVWIYGQDLPDARQIAGYQPQSISAKDATGQLTARRVHVPLSEIPPHVRKAFLAAEDQHFYDHDGISFRAIVRAALQNVGFLGGSVPAGGSTISQQVAKNVLLPGQPRSFERKVKEVLLAFDIEAELSKDEILEIYLNQIYFGGSQYGLAAASDAYFGKRPADLTIAESAYLAALPKAPNHYRIDQADNLGRAKARRDWVLARMADDGLITPTAAHLARAEPLVRQN